MTRVTASGGRMQLKRTARVISPLKATSVLLSRPCRYAIRALSYLGMQPPGRLSGTREISEHEHIPNPFLSKVLAQLRRGGFLRSFKGIKGGYELASPPDRIALLAIVRCIDGMPLDECILEDRNCPNQRPCPLHQSWSAVRAQVLNFLEQSTLAELVRMRQSRFEEHPGEPGSPILRGMVDC